jgi:hypothetical protein
MAHKYYTLSKNQMRSLNRVNDRVDISTIAAVDLEALKLVYLRETNDGIEVHLTNRGRAALVSGQVDITGM